MVFSRQTAVATLTRLGIHSLHFDLSEKYPLLRKLVYYSFAVTSENRTYFSFVTNFVVARSIGLAAEDHAKIHESLYETQLAIDKGHALYI